MTSIEGEGFLFLHKLEMVQVTFLKKATVAVSLTRDKRGLTPPEAITKSRSSGPSPAMLPMAHTACSLTFRSGELRREMKYGIAPADTTAY